MSSSFFEQLFSLSGKTLLLTGASGGIGRVLAHAYAQAGATVALHGRKQAELAAVQQEIAAAGGQAFAVASELNKIAACSTLIAIVAHGGVASALDTQTSLLGGVIRFTGQGIAERQVVAPGLRLVIGNTGVDAATAEINTRVWQWLTEKPSSRMHYFRTIGALSRAALSLLARGDWDELGRLFTLNQFVLEKIGVCCPECDRLIEAALQAGALGAKISGSGGGGIVLALVTEDTQAAVAAAITATGGVALLPEVGVSGAQVIFANR